jgi:tetratricopeptide (TPR) repeat protein
VPESLKHQIDRLQELYESELDPRGRAFVPLADAHRRLGDLDKALALIQEGLGTHPDFASAHLVLGWVHRSRQEPDDAIRSFERVLALDAENTVARTAIAELIDDQRAQAYRDQVVARESTERATAEGERPVVPIASLAPGTPVETLAAPDAAPELVPDGDRPVVPIASLAPAEQDETSSARDAAPESAPDDGDRPVVPTRALAPEGGEEASFSDRLIDGEIYTQTLAELYVAHGATGRAIEVYEKLIADDPDNEALRRRLIELESLESGADGAPAELDIRAGLGALVTGLKQRQTVSIESLAPDGNAGEL